MRRDDVRRIEQRYFIYRSIFAISELRKRRVHVHCASYHFRIDNIITWSVSIPFFQNPNYVKNLVCRYKSGKLPYVVYKEEILSWDPRIEMFHDVLSNQQAELMKAKAYPKVSNRFILCSCYHGPIS